MKRITMLLWFIKMGTGCFLHYPKLSFIMIWIIITHDQSAIVRAKELLDEEEKLLDEEKKNLFKRKTLLQKKSN